MPNAVRVDPVPADIAALGGFDHDYVDLFVADAPRASDHRPEEWARAAVEGAPALGRMMAWRAACGFQLAADPLPGHIGGWRIDGRGDDWIRLAASGSWLTARMVFRRSDEQVWFATFLGYTHPLARLRWGTVSIVHRAVAPDFLDGAVRRIGRSVSA